MKAKILIILSVLVVVCTGCHVYLKSHNRHHHNKNIPSTPKNINQRKKIKSDVKPISIPEKKEENYKYPDYLEEELKYHDEVLRRELPLTESYKKNQSLGAPQ